MEPIRVEEETVQHNGEPWQVVRVVTPIARHQGTRHLEIATVLTEDYAMELLAANKDYEGTLVEAIRSAVRGAIKARRKAEGKEV
jgi:hypothetical protein